MNKKINVTQVVRLNKQSNSINRTLNNLNPLLSKRVKLKILECPYDSNGFINKIKNLLWALKIKDDLGDGLSLDELDGFFDSQLKNLSLTATYSF